LVTASGLPDAACSMQGPQRAPLSSNGARLNTVPRGCARVEGAGGYQLPGGFLLLGIPRGSRRGSPGRPAARSEGPEAAILAAVRPLGPVRSWAGRWAGCGPGGPTWPLGRWVRWPVTPTGTGAPSGLAPLPLLRTGGCRPGAEAARVPGS
jgi:hypothetical protein